MYRSPPEVPVADWDENPRTWFVITRAKNDIFPEEDFLYLQLYREWEEL